jgi:ABC-type phosphate transport system permease subunit
MYTTGPAFAEEPPVPSTRKYQEVDTTVDYLHRQYYFLKDQQQQLQHLTKSFYDETQERYKQMDIMFATIFILIVLFGILSLVGVVRGENKTRKFSKKLKKLKTLSKK